MGRLTDDNGNATGLRWTLADPGMDILERSGLAALYMTLRAAEEQAGDDKADAVRDILEWDLSPDSVELRWGEPKAAKPALEALFAFAWQVRDGVLYLPAVHRDDRQRDTYFLRLAEHNGILRTSLQSNSQKKGPMTSQVEAIDDDKQFVFRFQPLNSTLAPHSTVSKLFLRGSLRKNDASTAAWVMPGIEPRFANVEKAWRGAPDLTLLLMLAPIVCLYQQIQGERSSELQVVPDIRNLDEFDEVRPEVRLDPVNAAGPSDAAATFLTEYTTRSIRSELQIGCLVVVIGIGGYYHKSNKTRKSVLNIRPDQGTLALQRFRILHRMMPSHFIPQSGQRAGGQRDISRPLGFFCIPSARGRIAENLVARQPWYADLLEPPRWEQDSLKNQREEWKKKHGESMSLQRLWFWNLQEYQKDQLMALVQHDQMTDGRERIFVEAFWDVLGAIYRREREAVKKQYNDGREITPDQMRAAAAYYRQHRTYDNSAAGRYLKRKANWNDRIGRMLAQAKTQTLLADRITELMRYAMNEYRSSTLAEHPDAIRRMLHDRYEWKRALHLARLALATYKPKNKR